MTEPTVTPLTGNRLTRTWYSVRDWFRGTHADEGVDLDRVRAKTPAPVLWLFGKTQSGKTSVVRYLTGADDAEIGNGFRPCTRTSRMYPFPSADAPVFTFLDTRGVDEPGYDPAEDIAAFDSQAHLILVTCRLTDFATRNVKAALEKIREANPRRPVLLVLTCLHEVYPQQQHPQPYPYESPTPVGVSEGSQADSVRKLIAAQRDQFAGLIDAVIPVDLTDPVEGYDDPNYGGPVLKSAILGLLPTAYRETLRHLADANTQFRDRQSRRAVPILVGYSSLAATAGALPVPILDLFVLPAIQTRMIRALAEKSGTGDAGTRFLELSASAGVGLATSVGLRQLAKLIPYVGSVVGASLAGASTYALGRAFLEYDRRVHEGHLPSRAEVAELYREHLAKAEREWGNKK